ncbi:FAD-dependent oxidoreductase [Mariniblastus sp.]|nr:FAD-dependent oxidoreductase [Mariniblastus sp.]
MTQFLFLFALLSAFLSSPLQAEDYSADIVIYGGTSAAVTAAVQASKLGKSVIVVSPDKHLGGLTSGGLGWTDSGKKSSVGGLSLEFYQRIRQHYDSADAWRQQTQAEFRSIPKSRGRNLPSDDAMWIFEPHVAEAIFEMYISENKIKVLRDAWLDRENGVKKEGTRILAISTLAGDSIQGKVFIDATYEGDLMAAAGVSYAVGREANSVYNETINGVQKDLRQHDHFFTAQISPYKIEGDPTSGLLPRISSDPIAPNGSGDKKIQAYCFRMCLTDSPQNRIPFPKPEGYDPTQYELLVRLFESAWRDQFGKFDPAPNRKTDTNNHGPFSTDNIGFNYDYPEASYKRRKEIIAEHETYQKGLMYFMANDERVPADVREAMSKWGLPKDEFIDNNHWSRQLYIREARRMIGEHVMTENDCLSKTGLEDSIGLGSYAMDSHHAQRYVTAEGFVQNEGDAGGKIKQPYRISYRAIVPKRDEAVNLLVPVALSASHIAYGSIRMEPVFMILGQSAATAASIAVDQSIDVQTVDYNRDLQPALLKAGQVLEVKRKSKSK